MKRHTKEETEKVVRLEEMADLELSQLVIDLPWMAQEVKQERERRRDERRERFAKRATRPEQGDEDIFVKANTRAVRREREGR